MKRTLLIVLALVIGIPVLLIIWQPQVFQHKILAIVTRNLEDQTSYSVTAGSVRGNIFARLSLGDLHIRAPGAKKDLLQAQSLRLGMHWWPLLHGHIEIAEITLTEPFVSLVIGPDQTLELPPLQPRPGVPLRKKNASGQPLALLIDHIAIVNGRIHLSNRSLSPPGSVEVTHLNLAAGLSGDKITVDRLSLLVGDGEAVVRGQVILSTPPEIQLTMTTHQFPIDGVVKAMANVSPLLRVRHTGSWQIGEKADTWTMRSNGTLDDAPLILRAEYGRHGPLKFQLMLDKLAVVRLWGDTHLRNAGFLSARLTGSAGRLSASDLHVNGNLQLWRPLSTGKAEQTFIARLDLDQGKGPIFISLQTAGLAASATAQTDLPAKQLDAQFQLSLSSFTGVADFVPALRNAEGRLTASGRAQGSLQALLVDAQVHGENLVYQKKSVDDLSMTIKRDRGEKRLQIDATIKNFALNRDVDSSWDVPSGHLQVEGQAPDWPTHLTLTFRNKASLDYSGRFNNHSNQWTLFWDKLSFTPAEGPPLQSIRPGSLESNGSGSYLIRELTMTQGAGSISMPSGQFAPNLVGMDLTARNIPLTPWIQLSAPSHGLGGQLNLDIHVHGPSTAPAGTVSIVISTPTINKLTLHSIALAGRLAPPWFTVDKLLMRMPQAGNDVQGNGRLPMHMFIASQPNLPISFQLTAPKIDPQILVEAIPGSKIDKGGDANLNLKGEGLYPNVLLEGNLGVHLPHFEIKSAGLDLTDLQVNVTTKGKQIAIQQFTAKTKKGDIRLSGESTLPELNFKGEGHHFEVNIPKKFQAVADFMLVIGGDLEGPDLSGELALQEGTYTVPKPKKEKKKKDAEANAEDTSDSLDPPGTTTPVSLWQGLTMDVHAHWPRNVWYRDGLSKIETSGDLRVQKDEGTTTPYMSGSISIVRGLYNIYGRDFTLNSGDIAFTGPPDINPLLNVRAQYQNGGTTVYLDVRGTASEPKLNLSSNPPLAPQDIISVLVIGQPLNQINPTPLQPTVPLPGQTLAQTKTQPTQEKQSDQAAALAGNVIGSYVTGQLRNSGLNLGLDVVRVDATTEGDQLTVGRYIGSKLFVSYGQPINSQAAKVFDADYYLSRRWTLSGETGTGDNHMDFLFRYPLNTPHYNGKDALAVNEPLIEPVQHLH